MLITAGTALLWPLSRRLANLVDVMIEEKRRVPPPVDDRVEDVLVRMDARLARLEEAQSFMSALDAPKREAVASAAGGHASRGAATPPPK